LGDHQVLELKDLARLGYDSQAIIKEVYFDQPHEKEFYVPRRIAIAPKSVAWMDATNSHDSSTSDDHKLKCDWCTAFSHFKKWYPVKSVLLSQEQDTTSESMKK